MRGPRLSILTFGALLAGTVAASGCAKRTPLSPKELAKVKTEAGVAPLRVYTERKLIALYTESATDESFNVDRTITEESDKVVDKQVTTRNTAGLILDIDELNGKPLLFVTFDASCKARECAYQFVETEDQRYRLVVLPDREGYDDPRVYRSCVWKKRRMKPGKLASLAEANEVYLVKKNNGKILTMKLEVKKVTSDRTQTRTRRNRGID
ncbi:MAG: hypothetical protein ACE37F_31375 [Nannocystaceae bacterium]|nr:hypothetical protein [bacterium]